VDKPVFTPSILVTGKKLTEKGERDLAAWRGMSHEQRILADIKEFDNLPSVCHTFVGCNGAQPGEVIFLGDCTHSLAGKTLPFPDLPSGYSHE
jgi:hypothetical protein